MQARRLRWNSAALALCLASPPALAQPPPTATGIARPPPTAAGIAGQVRARGLPLSLEGARARGLAPAGAAGDVAEELTQIVGRLVLDRASAAALGEVKARALALLGCGTPAAPAVPGSAPTAPGPAAADGGPPAARPFEHTCAMIQPLRIEDLAASPEALRAALLQDLVGRLRLVEDLKPRTRRLLALAASAAVQEVQRKLAARDGSGARVLAQSVLRVGLALLPEGATLGQLGRAGERELALAAAAVAACQLQQGTSFAECAVLNAVDTLALEVPGELGPLEGAHAVALGLQQAIVAPTPEARWVAALDATFAAAALLESDEPAVGDRPRSALAMEPRRTRQLALLRRALVAAVQRDATGVISAARDALALEGVDGPAHRRGLRLIAATLQYADTYFVQGDPKQLHETRVKVLRAVTDELGNREGREEDAIWSFGGSLAASAGARWARGGSSFSGPLSLPLGFALDLPGKRTGLHLELDALDLGEYVTYDEDLDVRAPSLEDALAIAVSLGPSWGKRTPFFVAASIGYSPHYAASPEARRGSLQVGVRVGVYVPLVDLN